MEHKPEILKIIEGGLEGDRTKVIAYANLLAGKCNNDKRFQDSVIARITGEYKKQPVVILKKESGIPPKSETPPVVFMKDTEYIGTCISCNSNIILKNGREYCPGCQEYVISADEE